MEKEIEYVTINDTTQKKYWAVKCARTGVLLTVWGYVGAYGVRLEIANEDGKVCDFYIDESNIHGLEAALFQALHFKGVFGFQKQGEQENER